MKNERFDSGKQPHIAISECHGDLVIRSWDEPEILAKGDEFEISEDKTGFTMSSQGRLRLMLPAQASLSLSQVSGDLVIKNIEGDIELDVVSGDAVLVELGSVEIGTIHNDLSAKRIMGPLNAETIHGDVVSRDLHGLEIGTVHGDLTARTVDGPVRLGEVMGDLSLRYVAGDASAETVHRDANLGNLEGEARFEDVRGDIRLTGSLSEGKHSFTAAGDIVMRWPEDLPLTVTANASKIVNRLQFDEVVESDGSFIGQIDGSDIFLTLEAKGDIILKSVRVVEEKWDAYQPDETEFDFTLDLAGLGERISSQVNEHVARLTAELETRFGPDFSQKMSEKIAKQAEKAAARAERAAERAMQRAERELKRSRARSKWSRPVSPSPPKKKATSDEQLKILKMVEQGVITTEEASTLLEALES